MKINHSLTALGIALALGSGFLPAMAQGAPAPAPGCPMCSPKEGPRGWMQGRMAEKLKLTDAQKTSLTAITDKHQASLAAKGKAAKDARKAFFEAMQKPETAPETLKGLNRAKADAGMEAMLEHRALRQEIRAVLTPDQREEMARMEGRREGMRMGRGGWGDKGMMGGHRRPDGPPAPAPVPPAAQ
jgi:Spy/CpxP family protein refolding chaperone